MVALADTPSVSCASQRGPSVAQRWLILTVPRSSHNSAEQSESAK